MTVFKSLLLCKIFTSAKLIKTDIRKGMPNEWLHSTFCNFFQQSQWLLKSWKRKYDTWKKEKANEFSWDLNLSLLQMCSLAALLRLSRKQGRISPAGVSCGPTGKSLLPPTASATRAGFVRVLLRTSTRVRGTTQCMSSKDWKRQVLHLFFFFGGVCY